MTVWDRFVCVDWSKDLRKRQAWVAEVGTRNIAPLEVSPTLPDLLASARRMPGRTVVAIDAALGVPRHYLEGARVAVPEWRGAVDFLMWLRLAVERTGFLRECSSVTSWRHDRPFISVPAGKGSLDAFWARTGGRLLRTIDASTCAKSPFIVSGVPGTVGSGTRALWCELAPLLGNGRDFSVWPFDGALGKIECRVAVAEIYPRVCYTLALSAQLPSGQMPLGKTLPAVREGAVVALERMKWVGDHGVTLRQLDLARDDEDHFDAAMSAAGLLRCALEGRPLEEPVHDNVEGGMLGLTCVQLSARVDPPSSAIGAERFVVGLESAAIELPGSLRASPTLACPITGCTKTYYGSRAGWDCHVGSLRMHPTWHPEERDPAHRKALFRREYQNWFS